jgi:glucosamine-6-phosphate deaminase
MEGFYPKGWDLERIDKCCANSLGDVHARQDFWHKGFNPVMCETLGDFDTFMGHEIALEIRKAKESGSKLAIILPVGPMGMYRWAVFFLKEWNVDCGHVHTFNMDEWSDSDGNTLPADDPAAFEYAMKQAFFNPLESLTVPAAQRNFATKDNLPAYADKIAELKAGGAKIVLVFGIGMACHIAFWEPQFALDYASEAEWKGACYRLGAKLHPLTIEQNALHSFKSRTTRVPCFANTIGPALFLQSDKIIGGCDGA